jgi:excisionase family DNA binding protein
MITRSPLSLAECDDRSSRPDPSLPTSATTNAARRDPMEPLQVSIREAARLLAYDERTIRRLIARGELIAAGNGRLRRVPMASLRAYQERTRSPSPHRA